MESLALSRDDATKIASLPSNASFMTLLKVVRQRLEPEYYKKMDEAKTQEEKAAALDEWRAFTRVYAVIALYPQEVGKILEHQEVEGQ